MSSRIAVIGPESSGKSTLARSLAEQFHGSYIPEYGRTYLEQNGLGTNYTYDDVLAIAQHQISELSNSVNSVNVANIGVTPAVFYDTELVVTKVWFEVKYGACPAIVLEALQRYPMDYYILCYPDIPWVEDPTRENGAQTLREQLFERYLNEVQQLHIPYYIYFHED